MNKSLASIVVLLICLAPTLLLAQVEDFQSWNSVSIDWKLNKDFTASAEQEIRFVDNASRLGEYISVVGFQYKVTSWLRMGAAYRLTLNYDLEDQAYPDHRIYTDLNFRIKPGRFTLGYRARYQIVFQQFISDNYSNFNPQHLRHKFSAKYNISKTPLYPFAEFEFYQSLNNPAENSIQKTRYTGGLGYPITDYATLEVYYRFVEKSFRFIKPKQEYVLGFSLGFSF